MKSLRSLGVFVLSFVILFSVTSAFIAPEKAYAQQDPSAIIQATVIDLFTSNNNALRTGQTKATTAEDKNTYQTLLGMMARAETVFVETFRDATTKNVSTATAYTAAINAAITLMANERNSNTILQRPIAANFIAAFTNQLTNESKNQERLVAISTGTAISTNAQQDAVTTATAAGVQKPIVEACASLISAEGFLCNIGQLVTWIIKNTLLQIAGFLLWLSANMLNFAIQFSILDFNKWSPETLYPIWVVVRQIVSLCVVFAGLYLGFMYIIDRGDKFEKYIPWVIMFALFVNFSYPIARTLVDVSNVVSLSIYKSALSSDLLSADLITDGTTSGRNTAGSTIMAKLGLQDLIKGATDTNIKPGVNALAQVNSMPGALLAVAFVLYAAYVFFVATAIIVMRSAILAFLIIGSPLLFLDSVIPKLGDEAVKLRKMFFEQLVVAPVFMIMLALTLKFLDVFKNTVSASTDSVAVFFNLLMMLIMLHIMLKVTKSVSGKAGEMATGALGKVGGFGLGVATGGAGFLARGTIGRGAAAISGSQWVRNNQDGMLGRSVYGLTNSMAKSSYDPRNVTTISNTMGKAGIPLGKGVATNYEADLKKRNADKMERAGRIQTEYTEDVFDRDGTVLHRAGDINEDGVRAANRFRQKEGGLSNTLLGKTSSFISNKQSLGKELAAADLKDGQKRESAKDAAMAVFLKEYSSQNTTKAKTNYLNEMKRDLAKTKTTDPNLVGTHGRALVEGIKKIEEDHGQEIKNIEEKGLETLETYTKSDVLARIKLQNDAKNNPLLKNKMGALDEYLAAGVNKDGADTSTTKETINKKVTALVKLNDSDAAKKVIENDTFRELQEAQKKEVETMQDALDHMRTTSDKTDPKEAEKETKELKTKYDAARVALAKKKIDQREQIKSLRKQILTQYQEKIGESSEPQAVVVPVQVPVTAHTDIDISGENTNGQVTLETLRANPNLANTPAYMRRDAATPQTQSTPQVSGVAPTITPDYVAPLPTSHVDIDNIELQRANPVSTGHNESGINETPEAFVMEPKKTVTPSPYTESGMGISPTASIPSNTVDLQEFLKRRKLSAAANDSTIKQEM